FCFVLHQGKMNWSEAEIGGAKYKLAGTLKKLNIKIQLLIRIIIYFIYTMIIAASIIKKSSLKYWQPLRSFFRGDLHEE
ncbi:hypothetical protein, partial [Dysgonomonas gadei]